MRAAAGLLALLLAGCSTTPTTVTVKVPVPVPCMAAIPERPAMPTDGLATGVDVFTFTVHAQAEIELREGYEGRLLAALIGCTQPPTASNPARPGG
jgi:starvation-inducible outer membrane lipoprotein